MKLFVYGTLKRGNPRCILKYPGVRFIEEVNLCGYTLYKSPISKAPVMVKSKPLDFVVGEIFDIPKSLLKELDYREGYKGRWYNPLIQWYKRVERKYSERFRYHMYIWTYPTFFLKHIGSNYEP